MPYDEEVLKGRRAFRLAWRRTPKDVRHRVRKAVIGGRAVTNAEDAPLAVGLARRRVPLPSLDWFIPWYLLSSKRVSPRKHAVEANWRQARLQVASATSSDAENH